MPHLTSVQQ